MTGQFLPERSIYLGGSSSGEALDFGDVGQDQAGVKPAGILKVATSYGRPGRTLCLGKRIDDTRAIARRMSAS
jgi:hypothetical protein